MERLVRELRESEFQAKLIKKLKKKFEGCLVLKNDSGYKQGIPDLLILSGDRWAALEVKRSKDASHRPNQDYYIDIMNKMSYASFISPETEEDILDELEQAFKPGR